MGSLVYISCMLLMTTVPLIDSSYRLTTSSSLVYFCHGEDLRLSCTVRFGTTEGTRSLSEVGWNRGSDAFGRINVTACNTESKACNESTSDSRGGLRYDKSETANNVAPLGLTIRNSTLKDNATFSCFVLNNNGEQTSQNITAIANDTCCSSDSAVSSEECSPGEVTSVPSPFFTPVSGAESPTGFSLVTVIIITAAGALIGIIFLLILVCFVRSKGRKTKRTKDEGKTITSTTTTSRKRHQNVREDVGIYTVPEDCVRTMQASHLTPVDLEHLPGRKAGPPGAPSPAYEVVSEAVNDYESQVVLKTPSQTAPVYQVLEPDETDRATDNEEPTCGGSEVAIKTPSQTAPVYEVLEPDETERLIGNEGTTFEECNVRTLREKVPLAAEDQGEADVGRNEGAGSPRPCTHDSDEGTLIENVWYVPYKGNAVV